MQRVPGLAVIPARGGSRRVPGKNTRVLDGIPAVGHVIAACQASTAFERIVISTDDPGIAEVARNLGAEVPFLRPAELADDHTGILPVVQHAVHALDLAASTPVACVYATAVTVDPVDLGGGLDQLIEAPGPVFIVSITEFDAPIQRALEMAVDGSVSFLDPSHSHTRSQDLPVRWHDAGQFVWGRSGTWSEARSVWDSALGFPVPHWRVIDVDTEDDWRRAELLLGALRGANRDR
jgi:pseudaminic acid cytidylyltransferase